MHISHGDFCFFNLGCESLGKRFGGGDLFPNLIGELFRAPESSKSQGSQFSVFFGGGKNDLATKSTRLNGIYPQRKLSTNRNELVEPRKKPS